MDKNYIYYPKETLASELTRDYLNKAFDFEQGAPEDFARAYKAVFNVIIEELAKDTDINLADLKEFFNR